METDKEKIMRLIKEIEHDLDRCTFNMLELSLEPHLRGETLVKLIKELYRSCYVRIDAAFIKSLEDESSRGHVRIWSY